MASRTLNRWLLAAASVSLLAGCGGGGGGSSNSKSNMSAAQRNYVDAASSDSGYATIR